MNTEEIKTTMKTLADEITSHSTMLSNMADALDKSIAKSKEETQDIIGKIKAKEQEEEIIKNTISDLEKEIETAKAQISNLEPKITEQEKSKEELMKTIGELETKLAGLQSENSALEERLNSLTSELNEKKKVKEDLVASIDVKVKSNQDNLEAAKVELAEVGKKYSAMEYLFSKIETPEVEVMAIIAANRPISTEDIKAKAKSVMPIMVGRAISKLEADGKIIPVENSWDLAPAIVEKL